MKPPILTQKVDSLPRSQHEWIDSTEPELAAEEAGTVKYTDKYNDNFGEFDAPFENATNNKQGQKSSARFAVFYIDKYVNPLQSLQVTRAMAKHFKLQSQHCLQLSSGQPMLIKGSLQIEQASQIKQFISTLGGSTWIQLQSMNGVVRERRTEKRRSGFDRRALGRTDINTDRRKRDDIRQLRIV